MSKGEIPFTEVACDGRSTARIGQDGNVDDRPQLGRRN